jgi:NAD-dependent dihydropyrimidine dehydrogenase PreA subunit
MIFYFTGTGNSRYIAEKVALGIQDQALNIGALVKNATKIEEIKIENVLGIVFPVYAWRAPEIVNAFVSKLVIPKGTYVFAICTCGDKAAYTMKFFNKELPLNSAWSLTMPDDYIRMWDVNTYEEALVKVEAAETKLVQIIEAIKNKQVIFDVPLGSAPFLKSYIINPFFRRFLNTAKKYYVEDTCTSCGLCEKLCPLSNIVLDKGKPLWGNNCNQCGACIHHCPVKAIQYGKVTKDRGRYTFKGMFKDR